MANAFGFVKYPQLPAPDPRKLGLALMQHGQSQMAPQDRMPMEEEDPMEAEPDMDADDPRNPRPRWRF